MRHRWILSSYLVEIFGIERVDEMDFSAGQAQHFDVAVLLNIEPHRFDVRQRATGRIFFPVVRVPLQDQIRPGFVFADEVGPQHCQLFLRRLGGHNRHLIKQPVEACDRRRKSDADMVLGQNFSFDFPVRRTERIPGRRVQGGIHELLHGVSHVVRRKRSSIGEAQPIAYLEGDGLSAVRHLPRGSEFGLEFLREPVHANQHAACEITNSFGGIIRGEQRVQRLGL